MFWFTNENSIPWVRTESCTSGQLSLNLYLYSAPLPKLKKATSNPFVKNTIIKVRDLCNNETMLSFQELRRV